jgi:hypothetical protein
MTWKTESLKRSVAALEEDVPLLSKIASYRAMLDAIACPEESKRDEYYEKYPERCS